MSQPSECVDCGEEFKNDYYLKKHYRDDSTECTGFECDYCDRVDLLSKKGKGHHETRVHKTEFKDSDNLRNLYVEQELGMQQIADRYEVSVKTVQDWLEKHDIETRDWRDTITANSANYHTDSLGYERWRAHDGDKYRLMSVHRLVAIAEHGFDAVSGNVIHHVNEIPWDNRPENLRVMSDSEHKSMHAKDIHSKWTDNLSTPDGLPYDNA